MKHNLRIIRGLRWLMLLLALLFALKLSSSSETFRVSATEQTPQLQIRYHNLSYSSSTYLLFAVEYQNLNTATDNVRMLFWDSPRTDGYVKGTEDRSVKPTGKTTINGTNCLVFCSGGLAAKQLTDTVYCRACVSSGGQIWYSEPSKYSAIEYILTVLNGEGSSPEDVGITTALRNYGAAAQQRFDYHTERSATDPFYRITLENAHLPDGFSYGTYRRGSELELTADVPEGEAFLKWTNDDGIVLGTEPTLTLQLNRDETVHAVTCAPMDYYSLAGRTFTANSREQIPYVFTAEPFTVEAAIRLSPSCSGRGGILLGNYGYGKHPLSIEIYNEGKVRLYCADGSRAWDMIFDTDVRSEEIRHLTLIVPEKGQPCRLYLDGELVEEKTMLAQIPEMCDTMRVGGDYRTGNGQYFKGTIYSLAVYRGVRSDTKIASDARFGANADEGDLCVSYLFDGVNDYTDRGSSHRDLTDERSGFSFQTASERYSLEKQFTTQPRTYEALFETSANVKENNKGCTIVGNYNDVYVPGITFRVYLDGRPSLCLRYSKDHQDQFFFPKSILGEGRVHVAITIDDEYVYGYLNGKQVLKKAYSGEFPELTSAPFSFGGDNRTDNSWWFRDGAIYSVRLFSEYRTAEQIREDLNNLNLQDPSLMIAYDFTVSDEDLSASGNNLSPYFYDKDFLSPDEYDYTIACIGDTQSLVKKYPDQLHCIYDFILDNVETMKISRVIGLGDITEDNTADQWELASEQIFRMDDVVPYTVVRGNHDHFARTPEAEETKELMFGYYFDNETYRKQFDGSYDGSPANTYKRFTVEQIPYLLLCLDYGPDDDVLSWASSVVEQYPADNVIVATHAFLFHDGTTLDAEDICPPRIAVGFNNCDEMWDKFVSKHANIVMVLCGHDPSNEIVVSKMTGDYGNTVTCCLIDPQHTDYYDRAAGLVALLHFKDGGSTVIVENYSTVNGKFYKISNEIVIDDIACAMSS